jgi:hypothetical protein
MCVILAINNLLWTLYLLLCREAELYRKNSVNKNTIIHYKIPANLL